jgi:hypothetical protein
MGALSQALIIFQVEMKWNNEKLTRKKKIFPTYNTHFFPFFFLLFGP